MSYSELPGGRLHCIIEVTEKSALSVFCWEIAIKDNTLSINLCRVRMHPLIWSVYQIQLLSPTWRYTLIFLTWLWLGVFCINLVLLSFSLLCWWYLFGFLEISSAKQLKTRISSRPRKSVLSNWNLMYVTSVIASFLVATLIKVKETGEINFNIFYWTQPIQNGIISTFNQYWNY